MINLLSKYMDIAWSYIHVHYAFEIFKKKSFIGLNDFFSKKEIRFKTIYKSILFCLKFLNTLVVFLI